MRALAIGSILVLAALSAVETGMLLRRPDLPFALEHDLPRLRRSNAERMEFCSYYAQLITDISRDLSSSREPAAQQSAATRLRFAADPAFFHLCELDDAEQLVRFTLGSKECWSRHDYECLWELSTWLTISTITIPRKRTAP
jgi:hypothetical protein